MNRIEIPLPIKDLDKYFRTAPNISPDMSQDMVGSFMQLQLPQHDLGCLVILTQARIKPETEGFLPFVLDIDISDESREFPAR